MRSVKQWKSAHLSEAYSFPHVMAVGGDNNQPIWVSTCRVTDSDGRGIGTAAPYPYIGEKDP